jgi:DNA-binding CsgD family transcriptional regulator
MSAEPYGQAWVVAALRATAAEAVARGAPEAAVEQLRRALAEPPAPGTRLDVLVDLGRAESLVPTATDFCTLREALSLARDPERRAGIALELALALFGVLQNEGGRVVLEQALADTEGVSAASVALMEAALIGGGLDDLSASPGLLARAGPHLVRFKRGEVMDPRMLAVLAFVSAVGGGSVADTAALAQKAIGDGRLLSRWLDDGYVTAVAALCAADALEQAAAAVADGLAEAQRRGSAPMFMQLALMRAEVALRVGDLDTADVYAQRALELGREIGSNHAALSLWPPIVLLERGETQAASRIVESAQLGEESIRSSFGATLLAHRGRVRVAAGELEGGVRDLLEADRRLVEAGSQMSVLVDWAARAALGLAGLGRSDEARHTAARELTDAAASGAPARHGMALSLAGLLSSDDAGLAQLQDAVTILQTTRARLEHARALVNLGQGLRERGELIQARDALTQGLDIAHRCGALAVVQRARSELVAAGLRPRRAALSGPDALTPAEMRTARMAAGGLSNREIAQALFVSAKTVEVHLSRCYAKLAIHNRGDLVGALSGPSPGDTFPKGTSPKP